MILNIQYYYLFYKGKHIENNDCLGFNGVRDFLHIGQYKQSRFFSDHALKHFLQKRCTHLVRKTLNLLFISLKQIGLHLFFCSFITYQHCYKSSTPICFHLLNLCPHSSYIQHPSQRCTCSFIIGI